MHLHIEGPGPHLPEMAGHFRHRALFIGPNARAAVNEGRAEYIPVVPVRRPDAVPARRILPLDAVLINVSPPDAHGFCSLGTSVEATLAAIRQRRDRDRPDQPRDAAHARRRLRPRRRHRPRRRGRRAALRARRGADRRRRARGSASTWPSWCRTARPCRWASARSRPRSLARSATSATWASTPRCSPTWSSTWSSAASSPARARRSTGARS